MRRLTCTFNLTEHSSVVLGKPEQISALFIDKHWWKRWWDGTCKGEGCLRGDHAPVGISDSWQEAVNKGIVLPQVTGVGRRRDPAILWRREQHLHLLRELCMLKNVKELDRLSLWQRGKIITQNQPSNKPCVWLKYLYAYIAQTFIWSSTLSSHTGKKQPFHYKIHIFLKTLVL